MPHSFWLGTRDPQMETGDVKTKKKGRGRARIVFPNQLHRQQRLEVSPVLNLQENRH